MAEYKHLAVKPETYERFQRFGKYGENADEVLIRLLEIAEKAREFSQHVDDKSAKKTNKSS